MKKIELFIISFIIFFLIGFCLPKIGCRAGSTAKENKGIKVVSPVSTGAKTKSIKSAKKIVVDLTIQHLSAYEDETLVMAFPVSTGKAGYATPVGTFPISQKQKRGRALAKYGGDPLPYAQRLIGHILIHGYPSVPNYPASHGCVRMTPADAKKLYDWTKIGTPVQVVPGFGECLL